MEHIRLLFLAANPDATLPLHAGREVRRIRERLAGAAHGSALEIVERWAVRPGDLQEALVQIHPHIVHFSGHGNAECELMLEGDDGSPRPVGAAVLAELFRLRGDGVRLVVLSACHSLPQAEAIAEHVDCAIGMRRAVGSDAAAEFSAALYYAIGSGDPLRRAFESARLHLEAAGSPEHRTPQLVVRKDGVDVERCLVRPPGAPQDGDEIAGELSKIARRALLAGDHELSRSLYDVEAVLARAPHHVEARLLHDRIERAVAARGGFDSRLKSERTLGDVRTRLFQAAQGIPCGSATFLGNPKPSLAAPPKVESERKSGLRMTWSTPGAPCRSFTGREREILDATDQLARGGVLVCGLGGMGKSTLARALVQAVAPRYPDLRITVDLHGTSRDPLSPAAAMAHVVRAFLPDVALPSDLAALGGLYRAVLEGQRALIFLEDARDRAQVEPLLTPAGSALVVTSRLRFALPGVHALSLDGLDGAAAVALLQRWAPALDGAAAEEIAELCGGVPLALQLAGGALRSRPDLGPEAYLERLRHARDRHELLDAALRVSFGLLDPILQIVWSRLGLFTSRFDLRAVSVTGALTPDEDVDALVAHGMIDHDPETGLYRLPRSARSLAMSMLTEADRVAAEQRFELFMAATRNDAGAPRPGGLERSLAAARRAGHRRAEALYLERMSDELGHLPRAAEVAEQALSIHRDLGDEAGEARVSNKMALRRERLAQLERDRAAAAEWRETNRLAAETYKRRAVELDENVGAFLRERSTEPPAALAQALSALRQGKRPSLARGAWQISVLCRTIGDLDDAILAMELCIEVVNALGWGPQTAAAALGRPATESLEAELQRLRASQAK
jgi:tetratricopeptide (TPR) repeat protein